MVNTTSNDNEISAKNPRDCDANGQAALLLVESLIHGLIARDVLPVSDAVDIIGSASDVAKLLDEAPVPHRAPHTLLGAIRNSLNNDLPAQRDDGII